MTNSSPTRRVVNICIAFAIIGDRQKTVEMGVNRCDSDVKEAFLDMYEKIDGSVAYTFARKAAEDGTRYDLKKITNKNKDDVKLQGARYDAHTESWWVTTDQYESGLPFWRDKWGAKKVESSDRPVEPQEETTNNDEDPNACPFA